MQDKKQQFKGIGNSIKKIGKTIKTAVEQKQNGWCHSITSTETFSNISRKSFQDILICYGMLPLPFPISFCLSFAALWVSSLPYLPEWIWGKQAFSPCTVPLWYIPFPFLSACLSDEALLLFLSIVSNITFKCIVFILFGCSSDVCLYEVSLCFFFVFFAEKIQYFSCNFITRVTLSRRGGVEVSTVSTVALKDDSSSLPSCRFSVCLCEFSWGTPASSHCSKTCGGFNWWLLVAHRCECESVWLSVSIYQLCNKQATCPLCALPPTQWQLR